jgi:hypothetical protein
VLDGPTVAAVYGPRSSASLSEPVRRATWSDRIARGILDLGAGRSERAAGGGSIEERGSGRGTRAALGPRAAGLREGLRSGGWWRGRERPSRFPVASGARRTSGDRAQAVAVELESLLAAHPELTDLAAGLRAGDRERLAKDLRVLLAASEEHAAAMLRTLLLDPESRADQPTDRSARLARLVPAEGLARSAAAIWMTILIALPVAWATATHMLGHASAPDADVNSR